MGTQTEIANKIIDKKADYVLALKANNPTLYHQVEQWFKQASAQDFQGIDLSYDQRVEKGHHRIEIRQVMIRVLSCCFLDSTLDSPQPLCQA